MRTVRLIAKWDRANARRNVVAIILIVGLAIIPSLYSWFNILAAWDPYGNTKNVKIAVANSDAGYTGHLIPLNINVGEQLVSSLRANDQFDWQFTDREDAIDGTRSGKYYAAVAVPEDFSQHMMSVFSDDEQQATITYYTNEKKNPLAPKLTGAGADGVTAQVNKAFSEEVDNVALTVLDTLVGDLNSDSARSQISALSDHLLTLSDRMGAVSVSLDSYANVITTSLELVDSADALTKGVQPTVDAARQALDTAKGAAGQQTNAIDATKDAVSAALDASAASYQAAANAVDGAYGSADSSTGDLSAAIRSQASAVDGQASATQTLRDRLASAFASLPDGGGQIAKDTLAAFDRAVARQGALRDSLNAAADKVDQGRSDAGSARGDAQALAQQAAQAVADAKASFDTDLGPLLQQLSQNLNDASAAAGNVGDDLNGFLTGLSGTTDTIKGRLTDTQAKIKDASATLTDSAKRLTDAKAQIDKALSSGDLGAIQAAIGSDPAALADAISAPVKVDRQAVYPVGSFGSQMTPFYTILSLWVGALLMTTMLRTELTERQRDELATITGKRPTLAQEFFGRSAIYLGMGVAQAVLACLGLLFFVDVSCTYPVLFVLAGVVASIVFAFINYTLTAVFGALGKAISVLLLVFQLAGSGGSFPVQMLPDMFTKLAPLLPTTHAFNAMRSAMAGIYHGDYWIQLGCLLLFVVPMLLIVMPLRRPLAKGSEFIEGELHRTGLFQ